MKIKKQSIVELNNFVITVIADKNKFLLILLSLVLTVGCEGNFKDVKITGFVKDSISELPIENAQVYIKCWAYNIDKWESDFIEKKIFTDDGGYFEFIFDEGEAFDLTVNTESFLEKRLSHTLSESEVNLDITLDKIKE